MPSNNEMYLMSEDQRYLTHNALPLTEPAVTTGLLRLWDRALAQGHSIEAIAD